MESMLSVGIIGLPNVGKSTLFNAMTAASANVSNYPFTTIDSNVGVVAVPDSRLLRLQEVLKPRESTPCFVQFVDIAGLVEGASQGKGLGNQFLGNIRQVDALAHVVRCFHDPDVSHVLEDVNPVRDVEIIESELLLADRQVLEGAVEKRKRIWLTSPAEHAKEKRRWELYQGKLESGVPLRNSSLDREDRRELKGLGLLTGKPVIYVANLSEEEYLESENLLAQELAENAIWQAALEPPEVVSVTARFEWELLQLDAGEQSEFMKELKMTQTGLERLVQKAFQALGLITFYTIANEKLQAWEVEEGATAPEAAGKVHSDMQQGFIRAEVVSVPELSQHGSFAELARLGLVHSQGKEYIVGDGDVIHFLFRGTS